MKATNLLSRYSMNLQYFAEPGSQEPGSAGSAGSGAPASAGSAGSSAASGGSGASSMISMTQEELNSMMAARADRASSAAASQARAAGIEEGKRQATMTQSQLEKEHTKQIEEELKQLKDNQKRSQLVASATKSIADAGFKAEPEILSKLVNIEDENETKLNVTAYVDQLKEVKESLLKELKTGKTPASGNGGSNNDDNLGAKIAKQSAPQQQKYDYFNHNK